MVDTRRLLIASFLLSVMCSGACHDDSTANDDGGNAGSDGGGSDGGDPSFKPAPHEALPPVPFAGGHVLKNIQLVSVTFDGFPQESLMKTFGDWIVKSSWYTTVGTEYGVAAGTHQLVHLAEAGPAQISSTQIGDLIAARIASQALPAPTPETLYLMYFPPNTVVDGSTECTQHHGTYSNAYHWLQPYNGSMFAFAVVPSCAEIKLSTLELGAAHEIIEAATDPFVDAWARGPTDPWYTLGSEIADNCSVPYVSEGHTVTRVWSNAALASGNADPCIPHAPYFAVDAVPSHATVAPGATAMFTLTGWSTAAVPDFYVFIGAGYDIGFDEGSAPKSTLDIAKLNNAKVGHATLTAPANAKPGTSYSMRLCAQDASDPLIYFCRPLTLDIQ